MIQFNLLPDIKLEYLRTRRNKRMISLVSIIVTSVFVGVLVILILVVRVYQLRYIQSLDNDIKANNAKLKANPNLTKILTIQNQLSTLPKLHDQKPVTSRVFSYLTQVTPEKISLTSLNLDFTNQALSITGSTDTLTTVNTYVDTLKFTQYKTIGSDELRNAFTEVVLSSFNKGATANFVLTVKFDKEIFNSANEVSLVVPKKITTRSETEKPLFTQVQTNQGGQ